MFAAKFLDGVDVAHAHRSKTGKTDAKFHDWRFPSPIPKRRGRMFVSLRTFLALPELSRNVLCRSLAPSDGESIRVRSTFRCIVDQLHALGTFAQSFKKISMPMSVSGWS